MSLLDDAIREHLELKRRRGADATEIARQEQEAFGAARRGAEPLEPPVAGEHPEDAHAHAEHAPAEHDYAAHEDADLFGAGDVAEPAAPHLSLAPQIAPEPEPQFFAEPEPEPSEEPAPEPAAYEPEPVAPPEPEPVAYEPPPTQVHDAPAPPEPAPAPPTPEPAAPEPEPHLSQPTEAFDPDEVRAATQAADEEDVLEETPEFLQETPEHDRLWFEQRPPRDFDF